MIPAHTILGSSLIFQVHLYLYICIYSCVCIEVLTYDMIAFPTNPLSIFSLSVCSTAPIKVFSSQYYVRFSSYFIYVLVEYKLFFLDLVGMSAEEFIEKNMYNLRLQSGPVTLCWPLYLVVTWVRVVPMTSLIYCTLRQTGNCCCNFFFSLVF